MGKIRKPTITAVDRGERISRYKPVINGEDQTSGLPKGKGGKVYLNSISRQSTMTRREAELQELCKKALRRFPDHERLHDMVTDDEISIRVKGYEIYLYGEAENHLIPQAAITCLHLWKSRDKSRSRLRIISHIEINEQIPESPYENENYNPSPWSSGTDFYSDIDSYTVLKDLGYD